MYTDHKPITFAFQQKLEKCSPRQFRYLDYIGQFSTDIQYNACSNNVVADTLSHIEEIHSGYTALQKAQLKDQEMQSFLSSTATRLQLKKIQPPETQESVYCDISTDTARPFVTHQFQSTACIAYHIQALRLQPG